MRYKQCNKAAYHPRPHCPEFPRDPVVVPEGDRRQEEKSQQQRKEAAPWVVHLEAIVVEIGGGLEGAVPHFRKRRVAELSLGLQLSAWPRADRLGQLAVSFRDSGSES